MHELTASRSPGDVLVRRPRPNEATSLERIWDASSAADDPHSSGGSKSSLYAGFATDTRVLVFDQQPVGLAAIRAEPAPDGAWPARVALIPTARHPELAETLVRAVLELIRDNDAAVARLVLTEHAGWALEAARSVGFRPSRSFARMVLAAEVPGPRVSPLPGVEVRPIGHGEDRLVLDALNHAWADTWNFVAITPDMLAQDLAGQRAGMLLAIAPDRRILATCHAILRTDDVLPDGSPRAWISNLTVDPAERGRGLARGMLARGIAYLRQRGATAISLGVDADNAAPFGLYRSVGFEVADRILTWDGSADLLG